MANSPTGSGAVTLEGTVRDVSPPGFFRIASTTWFISGRTKDLRTSNVESCSTRDRHPRLVHDAQKSLDILQGVVITLLLLGLIRGRLKSPFPTYAVLLPEAVLYGRNKSPAHKRNAKTEVRIRYSEIRNKSMRTSYSPSLLLQASYETLWSWQRRAPPASCFACLVCDPDSSCSHPGRRCP